MAIERLPNLVISDSAGSSETGAQMHVTSVDDVEVGTFLPGPGTVVVDESLAHVCSRRGTRASGGWPRPGACRSGISATPTRRRAPSR